MIRERFDILRAMLFSCAVLIGGCENKDLKRELESLVYEATNGGNYYCDRHLAWEVDMKEAEKRMALNLSFKDLKEGWRDYVVNHKITRITASPGEYKDCWIVCLDIDRVSGTEIKENLVGNPRRLKQWKKCPAKIYLQVFRRNDKFMVKDMRVLKELDEVGNEI